MLDLEAITKQRIVKITALDKNRKRYDITDPSVDPRTAYWP